MPPRSLFSSVTPAIGLAVALSFAPAIASDAVSVDVRDRSLALLHDGRFDAAESILESAVSATPDDCGLSFLQSFATYWRLLYSPDDDQLQERFERQLFATIELADRAQERGDGDPGEIALWNGSAHLLLAQLRASQRKPFGAAFEAKKAKKLLEQAVAADSPPADSDFGIGTYKYYADQVPTLLKGLRALLFIPGGDREEGLARLERAARRSRYFALEARILLAAIYADDREGLYDLALSHSRTAVDDHPDMLAVLHGAARLEMALSRPERARVLTSHALALAARRPGTHPSVVATLRYHAARAEIAAFRADRAAIHLESLRRQGAAVPSDIAESLPRLQRQVDELAGRGQSDDPDADARMRAAADTLAKCAPHMELELDGGYTESADRLDAIARADLDDPVAAFLAGRAALFARRFDDAIAWLRRAEASHDVPARMRGSARLLLGMAADLLGRRPAALAWYGRAADTDRFRADDAIRLYRSRPCSVDDLPDVSAD